MEIKIINPDDGIIKAIDWNHEELKKEITDKVEMYNNLVYDDEQIKEAKADRAELNKFKKVLEDKRKEIKSKCLAPYESFERQMKELTAIIDKPIELIDSQVKAFEAKAKAEKENAIREYFATKDFHGVPYEALCEPKWLNASTSMKSIEEAIDKLASNIEADITVLKDLPEYSFEAIDNYMRTLDLRQALAEAKRLTYLAKAKAEAMKAEEMKAKEIVETIEEDIPEVEPLIEPVEDFVPFEETTEPVEGFMPDFEDMQSAKVWVVVKALMDGFDVAALEEFLDGRGIAHDVIGG